MSSFRMPEVKTIRPPTVMAMPNRNQKIRENVVSPNGMSPESTVPQKLNSMCKRIE